MTAPPNNLPVRRPRHDGWTVERQTAFLKALANCGCVTHAARSVGLSRESAYQLYHRQGAAAFRRGWEAALDCSVRLLEDEAWSRATRGVARPIFYQGEQVGEYRHFDEKLTMFLLRFRRPHRYGAIPAVPPPLPMPPGSEEDGLDPDEAIGSLDYYLEDLEDEAVLSTRAGEPPAIDAVNFVKIVGDEPPSAAPPMRSIAEAARRDGE